MMLELRPACLGWARGEGSRSGRVSAMPDALQFFILTVAAWLNREQQAALEYLKRENEYLVARHINPAG